MCFNDTFISNLDDLSVSHLDLSCNEDSEISDDTDVSDDALLTLELDLAILSAELTRKEFIKG